MAKTDDKNKKAVHGLTAAQVEELHQKMSKFAPGITKSAGTSGRLRDMFEGELPSGANWTPNKKTAQTATFPTPGARQMVTVQTPYQPEFASPDRQQYPVHRILANRYWRLFYKLDPIIGNCIDMYSDMPWSNFELTGEGIEGEIRHAYEHMCRESQVLSVLPHMVREFLVTGEAIPHTYFNSTQGIFTHIAMHNPDQVEVVDAPFIKMDPLMEFVPDDKLRSILTSDQPELQKIRERMPPELINRLESRQNIPLSTLNATFIPRKLHPYDTRGTSIISRMWRVLMLEDAVFNSTLQMYRRQAAPLKVAKLGNAATGWIPPPEQEKRLLELLAQAELDPNAWLVYHYGIQFETVGTTDRAITVGKEWDVLERIKLVALGVNKGFLTGEVSYSSSATGLQVFMQRLKSMRMLFEQKWLYPKFFQPIAEINGWIKPKPSEVQHRFRVKRSAKELEEQNAYLIPKIVWDKSLDPQVNSELINAINTLESIGVKFSKTTKMAAVGYSFEEETKKIQREAAFEKQFLPSLQPAQEDGGGGGMGGGGGGPPKPPSEGEDDKRTQLPPGLDGKPPPGVNAPPAAPQSPNVPKPQGASLDVKADDDATVKDIDKPKPSKSSFDNLRSDIWVDDKYGNWDAEEVSDLLDLMRNGETDAAFWHQLGTPEFEDILYTGDSSAIWTAISDYLITQGYPESDIGELRFILTSEGALSEQQEPSILSDIDVNLPDNADSMSDEDFASAVANIIKKSKHKIVADNTNFLSGIGDSNNSNLVGDITKLMAEKKKSRKK